MNRRHLFQLALTTAGAGQLATGSPNGQVRAVAIGEGEQAQHMLLAADITRFLNRTSDPAKPMPVPEAPPGAPIGEPVSDWLARP